MRLRKLVWSLIICFSIIGCQAAKDQNPVLWHQHYEPLESAANLELVSAIFQKAQENYGPPFSPVREIHLRQSIGKKEIFLLSRADVSDPHALAQNIVSLKDAVLGSLVWNHFSPSIQASLEKNPNVPASASNLILLVAELNDMIRSDAFYQEIYEQGEVTGEIEWQYSATKRKIATRRFLEKVFPGLIEPMPHRQRRVVKGIELCEEVEEGSGHFVLYVSAQPSSPEFPLQLFHETFHLLNNKLYDWYVEGLGYVFARQMAAEYGLSWKPLEDYFAKGRTKDPYAIAYFMMQEVSESAGQDMHTFLDHAVWTASSPAKMNIDINAWLSSLPEKKKYEVAGIIARNTRLLGRVKGRVNSFILPDCD